MSWWQWLLLWWITAGPILGVPIGMYLRRREQQQ